MEKKQAQGELSASERKRVRLDLQGRLVDIPKQFGTVSSGALVLLATFLNDLFPNAEWKILIGATFIGLLVSLLFSLLAIWLLPLALIASLQDAEHRSTSTLQTLAIACEVLSLIFLFLGLCCFAVFSLINFY